MSHRLTELRRTEFGTINGSDLVQEWNAGRNDFLGNIDKFEVVLPPNSEIVDLEPVDLEPVDLGIMTGTRIENGIEYPVFDKNINKQEVIDLIKTELTVPIYRWYPRPYPTSSGGKKRFRKNKSKSKKNKKKRNSRKNKLYK